MNIKDSIRGMSSRDKLLLVVLSFALMFAGLYLVYTDLTEKREVLLVENQELEQKQNIASNIIKNIKPTEALLEAREKETDESYAKFYDNYDSPVNFERTFLEWLNGRNVLVTSFSFSAPTVENLGYNPVEGTLYPMLEYANELDKYGEDGLKTPGLEEDEVVQKAPPVVTDSEDEPVDDVVKGEAVVYSILTSLYNYELELSQYEYTKLVDEINYFSKYIYLSESSYAKNEEDVRGVGSFTIKVYGVDKPKQFEIAEDQTYFKYNTIKPIIVKPKEEGQGVIPSSPDTPSYGNTNESNNSNGGNQIGGNKDGQNDVDDKTYSKDKDSKDSKVVKETDKDEEVSNHDKETGYYRTKTGKKYHDGKICRDSHLSDSGLKFPITYGEINNGFSLEPCEYVKDKIKEDKWIENIKDENKE